MQKSTLTSGPGRLRKTLSHLLSTAGPILVLSCPAVVIAQVAVNTARVAAPSGVFEVITTNNESIDSDSLLAVLGASNDSAGPINGANGATNVVNVLTNDTLNGTQPSPTNITITVTAPASNPGVTLDPATGNVSVAAGVPAGTYTIGYQICETQNPTNCATATVTVVVAAPAITATPDTPAPVNGANGGDDIINAFANDTLNGAPVVLNTVTANVTAPATPINGGTVPVLDPATGLVDVPAGTPAGTYTISYQICENNNPANCAASTITVVVTAPAITAISDTPPPVNGANGGTGVVNVLVNDTLNGTPVVPGTVTATVTTGATPINGGPVPELNPATGLVDVPPGTPAGAYTIVYQICENNNPTNCASASVTITVNAPQITASSDIVGGVRSGIGNGNAGNVLGNDTLNGVAITPASIVLTVTSPASNPGVTLDPATGQISVAAGVPEGIYSITYQICERLNPSNCAQATVTVTVDPALSSVTGTVFDDRNGNLALEGTETRRDGWVVEIIRNGSVVATTTTDAQGNYRFDGLLSGSGYSIQFRNPDNRVVYRVIRDVALANNTVVTDQNLPLDPSGVVYDSVTRTPVRGAVVTLLGANGTPLPGTCFLSATQQSQTTDSNGAYRFDLVLGAASQCPTTETIYTISVAPPAGYSAPSTVLPAEIGAFDPTGLGAPVLIGTGSNAPANGDAVRWYQSVRLAAGDPDVIFNHIPIDPFLSRAPLVVTKTSIKRSANVGDLIPYTITVRNAEGAQRAGVDVIDILPPGFKYVIGTASINGVAAEPQVNDRELRWQRQIIPANTTVTYKLTAVVGAGVTTGDRVNSGVARNGLDGSEVSNRGQAVVSIVPSAVFDCAEVIGKVYDDLNGNGYQDQGEPGIPGARLATVNGELITTDEFGRYHITCAAVPDAQIGSNFVLKLDVRTIAQGYAPTTDNPQSIRLTRGKISELNFGVQKAAVTSLDIDARAFLPGSANLRPELAQRLASLRPSEAIRLVVQINYRAETGEDWALAERRVATLKTAIAAQFTNDWDADEPVIEANLSRAFAVPGRE